MNGDIALNNANIYRQQAERERTRTMYANDPFAHYAYMGGANQADQRRQLVAQQLQQQIMGQPTPTTALGGVAQLAAGLGRGLYNYSQQGQQFPTAPGGGAPSFATTLGNFFTGRNNGGLY